MRLGDLGRLDATIFGLTGVTSFGVFLFPVPDVTRVYQAKASTNEGLLPGERKPPTPTQPRRATVWGRTVPKEDVSRSAPIRHP